MKEKFSLKKRIKSFSYAFKGLRILVQEEHNARIHLFASSCVVMAGFYFRVSNSEWLALLLSMGMVIAFEIVNSAIENLADLVSNERNEYIARIKDLAAAAVLVSAIVAAIVGLIIFIPKITAMIQAF